MAVQITAKLATGVTFVGPIRGVGAMLGTGVLFEGYPDHAESAALNTLRSTQRRAAKGLPLHIFEPVPGHVAIYPHFLDARAPGALVKIPLAGTTFSIEGKVTPLFDQQPAPAELLERNKALAASLRCAISELEAMDYASEDEECENNLAMWKELLDNEKRHGCEEKT